MKCPECHSENPSDSRFCRKCGTQFQSPEDVSVSYTETLQTPIRELTIGSTFAERYQVIEEIGKGGMGKVYKVLDKKVKEKVALKLLKPEVASDEKTIERFSNELKFARKISHRNVCRMYDLSEEEGIHYITMEYVPGEDLNSSMIRMGPLSPGKAIFIARQVCEGLAEAHGLGVVHRDLKPQNIMIDKKGNARIMDFGIARSLKGKGITDAGMLIGTPEYMSPEQVEGKDVDHRSDIYSLGVILYEILTGKVPFEGETPLNIAMKHKNVEPQEPKEINKQIPEELNSAILKCMEKDKEKRYQSAEEFISELRKIENGIPTTKKILPLRKPITSREITVKFSVKKLFVPAIIFLAVILVGVLILRLFPKKEVVLPASGKPSLAIMYFENNTGDESFDHWTKALSDLLIADLSQSKHIMVLSGEHLFNILEDMNLLEAKSYSSKVLKEVAARGGVEYIVVGKLAMAGDTLRINTMLQKASTGELVGSEKVEGRGEESLFTMVDELTRKIKVNFKLSAEEIASDIDEEVGKITTSSPEAYKYYKEGRKYFNEGDYLKSIPLMEIAVAIDPEFAMAYRAIAIAYSNIGYSSEASKRLQKAFELTARVSDRERYQIQGAFYRQSEKTYDKAIESYNKLLQVYPSDEIANNNLGISYMDLEQWDKAIERLEENKKNKDKSIQPYLNLASSYMAKGLYDKAREVLEYYSYNISDNAIIHGRLAYTYLCQGEHDLSLVEAEKVSSLDPAHYRNFEVKGDIYHYKGDVIEAEKEYQKLLETDEPTAHDSGRRRLGALYLSQAKFEESINELEQGIELAEMLGEMGWKSRLHLYIAYMHLKSGNLDQALEECNKAWSTAVEGERPEWQRRALHFKGLVYLEMDSIEEAKKAAEELDKLIQEGMNKKATRLYHHLRGMVELENNNFSRAIEYFKESISLLPYQNDPRWTAFNNHALFLDSLGLAYYKDGNLEHAREEYEKIISLTTGRLLWGDIFAKSFYMLGKIYQEKNWKGKAIEHYEKFLDLWKDAGPDIPELIDAKKGLVQLQVK